MAGNLLLSAGTDLVRLLGCTYLTPVYFSLALGNLQNQMQFEVIAPPHTQTPLILKTMHGFLIQSNDSDVIQIGGNTDDPPITKVYSNIMMNSRRILNLPSVAMKRRQNITLTHTNNLSLFGRKRWARLMTDNMSGRLVMAVMGVITSITANTMLAPGRTLRMGLTACGSSAPPSHSAMVILVVNGA